MVLAISWVVSGNIRWFQLVLDRFSWFQDVLRFSNYGTSQIAHFCAEIYFILAFVQNFIHFDSQP